MEKILVINSGSATIKFKIFKKEKAPKELLVGIVERIGIADSFIEIKNRPRKNFPAGFKNHAEAFAALAELLKKDLQEIKFVGHRVVHGGGKFNETIQLNKRILAETKKFNKLAPLHNPVSLACAEKSLEILPQAKQFLIFDTAYYATIPDYAYTYAIPLMYRDKYGIRRYGFHGISHKYAVKYAASEIGKPLKKLKIISCHLGSGCSITATKNGQAVATSMGFTPLEGLMMSTRVGDIDAAVPLFMIEQLNMTAGSVDNLLNKKSGLLGVAGTMDMREILAAAGKKVIGYRPKRKFSHHEQEVAVLALNMFVYNIIRYVGQFWAVMGGVDLIVFTGGVGERSPVIREMVLKAVKHLGKFKAVVVPANEELMMAEEVTATR